ncbi:sugar transferase [Pseudarthrobacter oxydans]|uniref:sugar transferase n=1 Tax=Pseudarthrobacter oxydans TaxID=1671 RepID=UPI00341A1D20
MNDSNGYDVLKRLIDLGVALVALICSIPLQFVVAILVYKYLGRPILFRQARPGRDGQIFMLLKFRSMKLAEPGTAISSDATRLTPFGQALRASSLDELPSLWNVVKGDMSLVGPRPLLPQYLERYTPEQNRRHEVRPGITGLAQVEGRNGIGWDEKFKLDVEYVDSRSLTLDLRILAGTVLKVFRREGISQPGVATMSEFTGSSTRTSGGSRAEDNNSDSVSE